MFEMVTNRFVDVLLDILAEILNFARVVFALILGLLNLNRCQLKRLIWSFRNHRRLTA